MTTTEPEIEATTPEPRRSARLGRSLWWSFVEFFALSGIAFAQPTLDLLSKSPGLFYTRGTTGVQTILLVVLILVVPPAICVAVEAVAAAVAPKVQGLVHALLAGLLLGVFALEVIKKATELGPVALVVLGIAAGIAGVLLVFRFDVTRQFLRILAIAPVIFGLMFVAASPITDVVFGGSEAAARVGFSNPKRVVFVVLDELPEMSLLDGSGHIDRELFPNFARFADDATWYRNETTVAPYTAEAVPAITTGQYPEKSFQLPAASAYPDSVFSLLGKVYRMNVHERVTRMCPQNICKGARGESFGGLVDQSLRLWQSFASPNRTNASFNFNEAAVASLGTGLKVSQEFVDSLGPVTEPQLDYAHIELPHLPWQLTKSLQRYPEVATLNVEWFDPATAMVSRTRHLMQLEATDTLLGQIIDKLKRVDGYDDSMVIVTADHGIAFSSGQPMRAATEDNYPQVLWPPLLIKYPGQEQGKIDDRPASSVDIVPTIADVVGVKVPWKLDGSSLLGPVKPEEPRRLYQYYVPRLTPKDSEFADPPKSHYLTFDGPPGFEDVLKARAAPAGGPSSLRIYRMGPYGHLVGKAADPYVDDGPVAGGLALRDPERFDDIDKSAEVIPWAYSQGFVGPLEKFSWVAVSINGTIAAVSPVSPLEKGGGFLEFVVPPELVRDGKNTLEAYFVTGPEKNPVLSELSISKSEN
jgi:hypothetical protein